MGRVTLRDIDRELLEVSSWRGIADLFAVWAAVLVIAALAGRLTPLTVSGIPFFILAAIAIGVLQNNLNSLSHHAIHHHIYPDRKVNDALFRWMIAAAMGQNLRTLRREHLGHHALFGEHDDPERHYYDLDVDERTTPRQLLLWTAMMFSGLVLVGQVRRILSGSRGGAPVDANSRAAQREKRELLFVIPAQIGLFLIFWAVSGTVFGYFLFWAIPIVTVGAGLNAVRATVEHADPAPDSNYHRSFTSNIIERFVIGPFNFSYHYEHHRFMAVPYYNVDRVRTILTEAGDYEECELEPSYISRYRDILKKLRVNQASA